MNNNYKCLFVDFNKADLKIREQISLNYDEIQEFLDLAKSITNLDEIFVISTCNRTEIYYNSHINLSTVLIKLLAVFKNNELISGPLSSCFDTCDDHFATIKRLFEVGLGLRSQILGDFQILNQVKTCYKIACHQGTINGGLHRLFHTLFSCHKAVMTETHFHSGMASQSYAAISLIADHYHSKKDLKILIIGLGEMGVDVLKSLQKKEYHQITICNRTENKATELAKKFNCRYIPYADMNLVLDDFDIIFTCVSASKPIISEKYFFDKIKSKQLLFDLGVPRNTTTTLAQHHGLKLYSIDDLRLINNHAIAKRRASIPDVKTILNKYLQEYLDWLSLNDSREVIRNFKARLEHIRNEELKKMISEAQDKHFTSADLEKLSNGIINKIIRQPARLLNDPCMRNEDHQYQLGQALLDLFGVEERSVIQSK